jgi:hypothetical protein
MKPRTIVQILLLIGTIASRASSYYAKPDSVYLLNRSDTSTFSTPQPLEGWEAIKSRLVYPEKARQAKLASAIRVRAFTDSLGFIRHIQVFGLSRDSVFQRSIEKALISSAWTFVGKHATSVDFEIAFIPSLQNQPVAIAVAFPKYITQTWRTFTDSAGKIRSVRIGTEIIPDTAYLVMSRPTAPHLNKITGPHPIAGWDSLLSTFVLLRVRGNGLVLAHINFDSMGRIVGFAMEPKDPEFRQFLEITFKSFAWCAPRKNGKPVAANISIPIFFHARGDYSIHRLIVESR